MMIKTSEEQRHNIANDQATSEGVPAGHAEHRATGLLAIGLFKLSKAVFFFAVGVGALKLVHANIGDLLLKMATMLHFDPEGQFVGMLQDKADLISGHQLRQLSLATFGYSALSLVEGAGLMMQKTWAEYLTLTLTIGALPWELFELFRKPTSMHFCLLAINLAVLAYLLWFLRGHRRRKNEAAAAAR